MLINTIKGKNTHCSGMGLGIILLDETYPGFPGDVRNPSAFPYPIQYQVAEGLDIDKLIHDTNRNAFFDAVLKAAKNLEKMGCRAILAECGYFACFQKQMAASIKLPVFMSSLLQVPWAQSVIAPHEVVGLLMSSKEDLRDDHLTNVGIHPGSNYVVGNAMDGGLCPEFDNLWTEGLRPDPPAADYDLAEKAFVEQGVLFFNEHPNMGAMVLECTGFPPFAETLQQKIDIPIFSWGTLMDFAYSVSVHRSYYGHV
jgi:hypothetical protein